MANHWNDKNMSVRAGVLMKLIDPIAELDGWYCSIFWDDYERKWVLVAQSYSGILHERMLELGQSFDEARQILKRTDCIKFLGDNLMAIIQPAT